MFTTIAGTIVTVVMVGILGVMLACNIALFVDGKVKKFYR